MDRYEVQHAVETDILGVTVDIYHIIDTLPRKGRYPAYIGKMNDERLANMAVEVFNGLRKPKRRRNLQQTRNRR